VLVIGLFLVYRRLDYEDEGDDEDETKAARPFVDQSLLTSATI